MGGEMRDGKEPVTCEQAILFSFCLPAGYAWL